MGADLPKQYLPLLGRPLVYHALALLCGNTTIERVFVALSPGDQQWDWFDWNDLGARLTVLRCGGTSRQETVTNAIRRIETEADSEDWLLVHDGARPCLSAQLLGEFMERISADDVGGLLAIPLSDTVKRSNQSMQVIGTEPREDLWRAQTPQMFRMGLLARALRATVREPITDEAQAVEKTGARPKLVLGESSNVKVTVAEDLDFARWILERRTKDANRSGL